MITKSTMAGKIAGGLFFFYRVSSGATKVVAVAQEAHWAMLNILRMAGWGKIVKKSGLRGVFCFLPFFPPPINNNK